MYDSHGSRAFDYCTGRSGSYEFAGTVTGTLDSEEGKKSLACREVPSSQQTPCPGLEVGSPKKCNSGELMAMLSKSQSQELGAADSEEGKSEGGEAMSSKSRNSLDASKRAERRKQINRDSARRIRAKKNEEITELRNENALQRERNEILRQENDALMRDNRQLVEEKAQVLQQCMTVSERLHLIAAENLELHGILQMHGSPPGVAGPAWNHKHNLIDEAPKDPSFLQCRVPANSAMLHAPSIMEAAFQPSTAICDPGSYPDSLSTAFPDVWETRALTNPNGMGNNAFPLFANEICNM